MTENTNILSTQGEIHSKVGVVTFFDGVNYGGLLQTYGLVASLKTLGYSSEIINIPTPVMHKKPAALLLPELALRLCTGNPWHMLKGELKNRKNKQKASSFKVKNSAQFSAQKKMFDLFREHKLSISNTAFSDTSDIETHPPAYDAYICGSDQIWNPDFIWPRRDYFLTFAPQSKRVAYAPSFGVKYLQKKYRSAYREWISQIPHLSCREAAGVEIIKNLTGRNATHVLDPTLLLRQAEWDELIATAKVPDASEPYIFCYILGATTAYESFLESVITELGYRVITLPTLSSKENDKDTYLFEAGPTEFVSLVKHAKFVITDSFHGVVFSALYSTPFAVFRRNSGATRKGGDMFTRIDSLLSMCKIELPIANETVAFHKDMLSVDFSSVHDILQEERRKSLKYLSDALERACDSSSATTDPQEV